MLLLAAGGAGSELLSIWGHWSSGEHQDDPVHSMHNVRRNGNTAGDCRDTSASLSGEKSIECCGTFCNRWWVGPNLIYEEALLW